MLTVFTANMYAFCHCHHVQAARTAHLPDSGCPYCHKENANQAQEAANHAQETANRSQHLPNQPHESKDGCCAQHALLFSLLDKQATKRIIVDGSPVIAIVPPPFIRLSLNTPTRNTARHQTQPRKHIPPDPLSFYQRYQI